LRKRFCVGFGGIGRSTPIGQSIKQDGKTGEGKMMDQTNWTNSVVAMARESLATGVKNMDIFQSQAEEAIEMGMKNANKMQEATRKAYETWSENMDKARKAYISAVEEGLSFLEQQFSIPKPQAKAK
jgi:anaerobic ribonucleoside-triphosphate reductase